MKKKVNRDEKKLLTGKKLVSFFSLGGLGEKNYFLFCYLRQNCYF